MTATELRAWLTRHEMTAYRLAQLTGVNESSISRWLSGSSPIPPWIRTWCSMYDIVPQRQREKIFLSS